MDFIDVALFISYAFTIIAALAAIIFPIINSVGDPKSLAKAGIGVGALLVVFLISWGISGAEVTPEYMEFNVDAGLSKFIGGILTLMYILTGVAIVGIIYTEISKSLK